MSNALIFGGMAIVSLFVFMNLGKIKASKNQTGRENRINRFKEGQKKFTGNKDVTDYGGFE